MLKIQENEKTRTHGTHPKCFLQRPRGKVCKWGPRRQGPGPGSSPGYRRPEAMLRCALPPGARLPFPSSSSPTQVTFTFLSQRPFWSSVTCSLSPFLSRAFFCLRNFLTFLSYSKKKKKSNKLQRFAAIYSATLISYPCPTAPD